MKKSPQDLLKEWMQLVNSADLEHLVGLYDKNAILIPTFSNRLLSKPEGIRDYFEKLCSREELSIALHEKTLAVQSLEDEVHALSGIYCWRFGIDGELFTFEARFSMIADLASPTPILHQHSSQIPRML